MMPLNLLFIYARFLFLKGELLLLLLSWEKNSFPFIFQVEKQKLNMARNCIELKLKGELRAGRERRERILKENLQWFPRLNENIHSVLKWSHEIRFNVGLLVFFLAGCIEKWCPFNSFFYEIFIIYKRSHFIFTKSAFVTLRQEEFIVPLRDKTDSNLLYNKNFLFSFFLVFNSIAVVHKFIALSQQQQQQ